MEQQFFKIALVTDLSPGIGKAFQVQDKTIALFQVGKEIYAIDDACPHRGASLAEGICREGKVFCNWHLFDFDLKTGACGAVPSFPVEIYALKIEGNDIFVLI